MNILKSLNRHYETHGTLQKNMKRIKEYKTHVIEMVST